MLRSVPGFDGAWERVVRPEPELVVVPDDPVQLVSDRVVADRREWIHIVRKREREVDILVSSTESVDGSIRRREMGC